MAPTSSKFCLLLLTVFQLHLVSGVRITNHSSPLSRASEEKTTNIQFFFHDIITGKDPTAEKIAEAEMTKTSATGFGMVAMFDNLLTEGPDATSKPIGRAQDEFNGSSLSILGRNQIFSSTKEMPVIGGTGMFRLAQGYALAKTHTFDLKTGNAVVEYNVLCDSDSLLSLWGSSCLVSFISAQ